MGTLLRNQSAAL